MKMLRSNKIIKNFIEVMIVLLVLLTVVIKNYIDLRIYFSSDEIQSYFVKGFNQITFSEYPLVAGGIYIDLYHLVSKFLLPLNAVIFIRMLTSLFFSISVYFSVRFLTNRYYGILALTAVSLMPFTYSRPAHHLIATSLVILSVYFILKFSLITALIFVMPLMTIATGLRAEYIIATSIFYIVNMIVITDKITILNLKRYYYLLPNIILGFIFPLLILFRYKYPYNFYSSRSYEAFASYYNIRTLPKGQDPYYNWDITISKTFGPSQSLIEALIYSPTEVLIHIFKNIIDIPKFLALNTLQIPNHSYIPSIQILSTVSLVILFLTVIYSTILNRKKITLDSNLLNRYRVKFLMILILLIPNLFSMTLIYTVYMQAIFGVALILIFLWLNYILPQPKRIFAIFFVLYSFYIIELNLEFALHKPDPTIQTIYNLNSKKIDWKTLKSSYQNLTPAEIILLQVSYAEDNYENYSTAKDYIESNSVNIIFYNDTLNDANLLELGNFDKFMENPKSLGFVPLDINAQIWIKVNGS
jgi:hypothetical protein